MTNSVVPSPSFSAPESGRRTALILLLLIVPILGLYLWTTNDGIPADGSDWAMYVMHARNIATGHPYAETNYVNQPEPQTGAETYPSGYPLLLAPFYAAFGLNIRVFKVVTDIVLALSLWPIYLYVRRTVSAFEAVLILLLLALGYEYLTAENNIDSDALYQLISFAALVLTFWIYENGKNDEAEWTWGIATGLVIAAAYLTRPIGIALLLGVAAADVIGRRKVSKFVIAMFAVFIPLVLVNNAIFHRDAGYSSQFIFSPTLIVQNAIAYFGYFSYLFTNPVSQYLRYLLWLPTAILALAGLWISLRRNGVTIVELYSLILLAVLFVYHLPNPRYLLPLLPIYLVYVLMGFHAALKRLPAFLTPALRVAGVLALLTIPAINVAAVRTFNQESLITHPGFAQLCGEMKTLTGPHEYILFWNPRVLALYTNRPASAYPNFTPERIERYLSRTQPNYIVFQKDWPDDRRYLAPVLQSHSERFAAIYENDGFRLMRVLDAPGRRSDPPAPIRTGESGEQ